MDITIGQQLTLQIRLTTGEQVERVQVKQLLGLGGFARVWKVRDCDSGRHFALKHIAVPALLRDGKVKAENAAALAERLRSEAQVRIASPYVLTCLGHVEQPAGENFFLIFPLFGEHDLKTWIEENRAAAWPAKQAIFLNVLKGVYDIHRAGYVHRDLKPQNILVDADNTPKITDFGLVQDPAHRHTQDWSFAGTYPYQDPRLIIDGGIKHADARSDVYALGIILYELAVGHDPWSANDLYYEAFQNGQIFNLITGKRHILELDRRLQAPTPVVRELIAAATHFDRNERMITIAAMLRKLGGEPVGDIARPAEAHVRGLTTTLDDLPAAVFTQPPIIRRPL